MIALALGGMRLDPAVFWRLSLREWLLMQRGFFESKEMESRQQWETARMVAYFAVKPHVKRGALNQITDLVRFAWDAKTRAPLRPKEEIMYLLRKYGQFYNQETGEFHN